jgi:TPR repeat protein
VKWFRKSAEQGFARAQYRLGSCYHNGEGVEADKNTALYWYKKAMEHKEDLTSRQIMLASGFIEILEEEGYSALAPK